MPHVQCGICEVFSGCKIPIFSLMIKIRKPSASTLGYIIRILMIVKLAISIFADFPVKRKTVGDSSPRLFIKIQFLSGTKKGFSFHRNPSILSGRRGSNPRPTAWEAVALPTELLPRIFIRGRKCKGLPPLGKIILKRSRRTGSSIPNGWTDQGRGLPTSCLSKESAI